MNRKFVTLAALAAGLVPFAVIAQVSPAVPAAAPAAAAPVKPEAIPAKIALIAFQQAVIATNEGQRAVVEIQKKYEPKKTQIEALSTEIDGLKKQIQAAPATLPDEERASRLKTIDTKEKQLQRDGEDATNAYNSDLQEAYSKVATKVNGVMQSYAKLNGFTLVIDVSNQQSAVMWALENTDITEAVITAYNASTPSITAPPPAAPSAARPKPAPATAPRTAPKPPSN